MTISFEPADAQRDRDVLLNLNVRYFEWMELCIRHDFAIEISDLLGGSIAGYVASVLDKLCAAHPPEGVFYVVRRNGQPAGMGGVRKLADGVSEMKRVFVLPDQRGGGLGAVIVKRLIADSDAFGYPAMRLDSGPFMASAHKLYDAEGFKDRDAYEGAEVPTELRHNWRFMERVRSAGY
jgi:GNAT superfamily N-acetyltransferase